MRNKMQKITIFIFLFMLINGIMSFLFIPAESASKNMWKNYQKMKNLDLIYIGSSVCQCTFNPVVIDEVYNANSYNMGTVAQTIDLSYIALETALKEHDIKKVIFGFGYFTLLDEESQQAEVAFIKAKNQQGTIVDGIVSNIIYSYRHMGESISINFWMPWVNNHVDLNWSEIVANVDRKFKQMREEEEQELTDFESRGMRVYTDVINYEEVGDNNSWNWYQPEFSKEAVAKMREICRLCNKNNVELIVANIPRPTFDITTYAGDYYGQYLWLKEFFSEYEVEYYDFNFVKSEIFVSRPEYYYNFEHLNSIGANVFSKSFAEFMLIREHGKDTDDYFYNWEEYCESISLIE